MRRVGILVLAAAVLIGAATSGYGVVTNWRYDPATGKVYGLTSSATWANAEADSVAAGGHLVTIGDAAENKWVQRNYNGYYWIGLFDNSASTGQPDPPGDWYWVSNGAAPTYTKWHPGEPNGAAEDHSAIRGVNTGTWNDLSGTASSRSGICELDTAYPADRVRFNPATGNVYARSAATNLTWETAEFVSQAAGGNLVTINDQAENDWVQANIGGGWIGFNDKASPGTYVWASGQTPGYTNWNPGEPNNIGSEPYGEILGTNGKWNNLPASLTRRGIAEIETNATVGGLRYNPATQHVYAKTNNLTFNTAELVANAQGASLATISDANENTWVRANMGGGWIGFNDDGDEGTWTWTSGTGGTWDYPSWSGTSYENWYNAAHGAPAGNEPNGGGGENLAELRSDGYWNDLGHSHTRGGIIEFPTAVTIGSYRFNSATGHVYAKTNSVPWEDADRMAQAHGADLVTIDDAAENSWVAANMGAGWLGFNDAQKYDHWQWTSGTGGTWDGNQTGGAGTSYTNWNSGEPNGRENENYAEVQSTGGWNDLSTQSRGGIIEFPDAVPNTSLTGQRYNPATDKLYALTASATWRATELIARVNGTHLATVNDAAENTWLNTNMAPGANRWIGLNDEGTEGNWEWSSGESSTYTNWNSGEPNGGTGENYTMMYGTGGWNDAGAASTCQGIVEMQARTPQWRFNPGSGKLIAQTDYLMWEDAELQAQNWGGHLATVPNAAANEAIRSKFGGGWIGFNDKASEGNFVWASGQPVTYTNWRTGEPNNSGGAENYTTMSSDGQWNDYSTQHQYGVAEKKAVSPRWVYNPDTGHFYAFGDSLPWADAEEQAQYHGAHLTTINDAAENEWVRTKVGAGWIGLNDNATEGSFVWASGQPVTYTNWNSGEPNGGTGENCGYVFSSGLWNDYSGTRYGAGILEHEGLPTLDIITNPATGKQYALLGLMTWEEAETTAQALYGHLVTVQDAAENQFLLDTFAAELGAIWIGYTDKGLEGVWEWADATSAGYMYTNWNGGEPNDAGVGEDYAAMRSDGLWNDVGSTARYYAVMEFIPEPTSMALLGLGLAALARRRRRRA